MSLAFKQGGNIDDGSFYSNLKETVAFWMNHKVNMSKYQHIYLTLKVVNQKNGTDYQTNSDFRRSKLALSN